MKVNADGDIEHIDPDDLVSAHFRCREFEKGEPWPPALYDRLMRLAVLMEHVRQFIGVPLAITSGYRSPEHNARVKGAANRSQHIHGRAVDFRAYVPQSIEDQNAATAEAHRHLAERADELGIGGLGWYPPRPGRPAARVHVDLRARPVGAPLAKWIA